MLTDRGRRVSICIGTLEYGHRKFAGGGNGCYGGFVDHRSSERCRRDWSPSKSSASRILRISSPTTSPPSANSPVSLNCSYSNGAGYIEHRVSKFDTLAGIAIKYGVEVADITKLNGLVTDLQMFALKSLRIPLPGRHPPSPCLSNSSSFNPGEDCSEPASSLASNGNLHDVFDPFQSLRLKPSETKISPAMDSLQGYYGLKPTNKRASEASYLQDNNGQYLPPFPTTSTPLNQHRKSRSLVDAVIAEVNQSSNPSKEVNSDKPPRRRQKSEADFSSRTPELLLKKESRSGFSAIAGKGLALRPKAASKTNLSAADTENGNSVPVPINLMDAPVGDRVRKSFSASILQEPVTNNNKGSSSSLWPTLKADLLTQAAMARSIFDGLPKPLTGRRNKKAVD